MYENFVIQVLKNLQAELLFGEAASRMLGQCERQLSRDKAQ